MFALGTFLLIERRKNRIVERSDKSGLKKSFSKVRRATLAHLAGSGLIFARLTDRSINTGVSGELGRVRKTLNITDFAEDKKSGGGCLFLMAERAHNKRLSRNKKAQIMSDE